MRSHSIRWSAVVVALLICSAGCTQVAASGGGIGELVTPPVDRGPFPYQGETLEFGVKHASMDMDLLTVRATVGFEGTADDGTPFIPIYGVAESVALARFVARVHDDAHVFIEPTTWRPIFSRKHLNENENERLYNVWFWQNRLVASMEKHKKGVVKKSDVALPPNTIESVSWVYNLRQIPSEVGTSESYYIYDGWALSKMTTTVQGTEDLWTPLGFFKTVKLEIFREKYTPVMPQGALAALPLVPELVVTKESHFLGNVWLSDDTFRIPLRIAISTKIGDIDLLLSGYSPPKVEIDENGTLVPRTTEWAPPGEASAAGESKP